MMAGWQDGKVLLIVGLAILPSCHPAVAHAQATGRGHAPGGPVHQVADMLREGYISFFSEDPTDEVGIQTADFFRKNKIPIELARLDPSVLAIYSGRDGKIIVSFVPLENKYAHDAADWDEDVQSSTMASWQESPESLRDFVKRTALVIVHETGHAIYSQVVGTDWNSVEEEQAVRGREMLFLKARLRRDPDFLRLRTYDKTMRGLLAPPSAGAANASLEPAARSGVLYPAARLPDEAPPRPGASRAAHWWREPLPAGLTRKAVDDADAAILKRFPGEFDRISQPWYQLCLLGSGVDAYWSYLASVLPGHYESDEQDFARNDRGLGKRIAAAQREVREADAADRAAAKLRLRELREQRDADQAFHQDRELERTYRAYFVLEHLRLKKALAEGEGESTEPVPPRPN